MLHHYQRHILDLLGTNTSCRYSDLKPEDVDGNTFTYHLKQLCSQKYIERLSTGEYALTQRGRAYMVHRYEDLSTQAHSIFLIVLKIGDQLLLRERLVQPLINYTGFIHGEPSFNEPVQVTAERRLLEKTGITCKLNVTSSGLIRIFKNNELQSHSHAIILTGELPAINETAFVRADATGRNLLVTQKDMQSLILLPSCDDILVMIRKNIPWFERDYNV